MKKHITAITLILILITLLCMPAGASAAGDFSLSTANGSFTEADGVYTLTSAGSYTLSGTLSEGRIVIDAGKNAKIELVLEGAVINCSYAAPLEVTEAKELKIKAAAGSNNEINDLRPPVAAYEGRGGENAAVSGDCDIDLCGKGSLVINAGCGNGIHSREKISVKNISLEINSVGNCIKGNEGVSIESGSIKLVSQSDSGIRTADADVSSSGKQHGDVEIRGGSIYIYAHNDGIHAENRLSVSGGSVTVEKSTEGFEANVIDISGGSIFIYADDDGMNACHGNASALVCISGGYVEIETPFGDTDGIDSNGSYIQTGGTVLVKSGCTMGNIAGSIDVDGSITVTGGTVIALGGICELPENSCCAYVSRDAVLPAGEYVLKGSSGEIFSFGLNSEYRSIWLCCDGFAAGGEYELSANGSPVLSWTQEEGTMGGEGFGFGPGGPGGRDGGFPGGSPGNGNPPEGGFPGGGRH